MSQDIVSFICQHCGKHFVGKEQRAAITSHMQNVHKKERLTPMEDYLFGYLPAELKQFGKTFVLILGDVDVEVTPLHTFDDIESGKAITGISTSD